jgi:tRNA nucleotidyltransferase/poly(A) polymerase
MALESQREMAYQVVLTLQHANHLAYWVGGCVRDQRMGLEPKDFDVATSAHPQQVLALFPGAQLVGASFGVVLLEGGIEIATFRSESQYTDGRRPSQVQYETNPALDASRRDFTINAMFFDPIRNQLYDFVGGEADLEAGLIRAIGNPIDRFAEDHLRLLRAIRFAARFGFQIEPLTFAAIETQAASLQRISGERIHDEMRHILTGPNLQQAEALLRQSRLLEQIIPYPCLGQRLARLQPPVSLSLAWAALLEKVENPREVYRRFRFSDQEATLCQDLLENEASIEALPSATLPTLKRFLRKPNIEDHLALHRATFGETAASEFLEGQLTRWSTQDLWPTPLLDGKDLIALDLAPGPRFREILNRIEDAQLSGEISTREQAIELAVT